MIKFTLPDGTAVEAGSVDDAAACDSNARASALPTDKGYAIRLVAWP